MLNNFNTANALNRPSILSTSAHKSSTLLRPSTSLMLLTRRFYSPYQDTPIEGSTRRRPNLVFFVPQRFAYVIERFGKFDRVVDAGIHFIVPIIDRVAYIHSLKEQTIPIAQQMAITMDNVYISIDGVLYLQIVDPVKASYGVTNIYYAMTQLAQTTMRSELGKITLDKTFAERESLNANIVESINSAAEPWGVKCLRYEIRDITPPESVRHAMELQAEAERRKRATILDSEGAQQSDINLADGARQAAVLTAQGEAAAIIARAEATAKGINLVAEAIANQGGHNAVTLRVAEQYIEAFGNIAKQGNTILLPANSGDASSMIAQAMSIYNSLSPTKNGNQTSPQQSPGKSNQGNSQNN